MDNDSTKSRRRRCETKGDLEKSLCGDIGNERPREEFGSKHSEATKHDEMMM
jgi:hypothetical protein